MKKLLLTIVFNAGCEKDAPLLATDVEEFLLRPPHYGKSKHQQ